MKPNDSMTRVLIVDDSPSVRELLAYIFGATAGLEVIGFAANGEQAVRMTREMKPDVITMDLHMPNMNGFEATSQIMQTCPTPIVIVSGSDDRSEMEVSFQAIEAGALVVVQRPFGIGNPEHEATANVLIRAVKSMAEVKVVQRRPKPAQPNSPGAARSASEAPDMSRKLVIIGASTGGPAALREILAELPFEYSVPVVVVQHMSPGFVAGFVAWLASATHFPVTVAESGELLAGGRAYLAPDGFQLGVTRDLRIKLTRADPEHGMCPSVSHLFRSIGTELCGTTAAVLLTGMGKDGALELRRLKDHGALTIVQDRATSAVYGMPGEAIRQDAAQMILAPAEIGKVLRIFGQDKNAALPLPTAENGKQK